MAQDIPYGKRLLPVVVDEVAARSPDRTFASIARPDWRQGGWYDISYKQVAGGINAMAWWLDRNIGTSKDFDTFAYMGPNDLRYVFVLLAAIKTRRKLLLADNLMAREGRLALIVETRCSVLLAAEGATSVFEDIRKSRPDLQLLTTPSFDECINTGGTAVQYPYEREYERAQHDPILILHTSGTTGRPKALIQTNRTLCSLDAHQKLSADSRKGECMLWELDRGKRTLIVWPIFWLGAILTAIVTPIMWDSIPVLPPLDVPRPIPGADLDAILQKVNVHGASMPPAAVKELCKNAEYLKRLRKLEWLSYAGAPLKQEVGDLLADHVVLQAAYGSLETGGFPIYVLKHQPWNWRYYKFHPACGFRMEQQPGNSDVYELIIDKKTELADFQIVFDQFAELDVWHTNDLFRKHPQTEDLWLYSGRKDDFIKLAYLTKFQGVDVEEIVERHPNVHRALVGRDAQESTCLLVELEGTTNGQNEQGLSGEGRATALDDVWPMVDREVNEIVADIIKIKKDMIIIVDRPLKLTGKGTVDRSSTLQEFKREIDRLYDRIASSHE